MEKIRVLLANYPRMVPDAVRQLIGEQEDVELVGDCRGPMKILQETGRVKADAVIFAQEGPEESGLSSQLLAVYPDLTILSVACDLGFAFTQQLCSHRREFTDLERQDLLQSLCTVVRHSFGERDSSGIAGD